MPSDLKKTAGKNNPGSQNLLKSSLEIKAPENQKGHDTQKQGQKPVDEHSPGLIFFEDCETGGKMQGKKPEPVEIEAEKLLT